MPSRRAVLLCSNPKLGQRVLRSLWANGFRTQLIYDRHTAGSVRFSPLVEDVLLGCDSLERENPERILAAVNAAHQQRQIDLVLSADVIGLTLLAQARERLQPPVFPMPSLRVLRRLDDKWDFYGACLELGIGTPETVLVSRKDDLVRPEFTRPFGFPLIVKPLRQYGSIGVCCARNAEQLRLKVIENPSYEFDGLLVQKFVPGLDVGLGLFARAGRVEQWSTFVCGRNGTTEFTPLPRLLDMGRRICEATSYDGVANFDARYDPATGTLKILECNPRFFMRMTANRMFGLDFLRMGLSVATQHQAPTPALPVGGFYPTRDALSLSGISRLARGVWPAKVLLRTAWEALRDPLLTLADRFGMDAVGR